MGFPSNPARGEKWSMSNSVTEITDQLQRLFDDATKIGILHQGFQVQLKDFFPWVQATLPANLQSFILNRKHHAQWEASYSVITVKLPTHWEAFFLLESFLRTGKLLSH